MLEELSLRRQGRLIAFAVMIGGAESAEDLVQEAVIATFSSHNHFDSVAQAEHYVRRAIASKYVDLVRKSNSRRTAEAAAAVPENAGDGLGMVNDQLELQGALAHLSPRERACVVLRYLEQLSVKETADVLRLSEGAVKRYVHDGLARLNQLLGTNEPETDLTSIGQYARKGGAR